MRAMWIGTETARRLGLQNDFFDRKSTHVTPPGASFLRNSEHLYGLWFFAINNHMEWDKRDRSLQTGEPDENGLRSFQGRASFGALRTTHYWLAAILVTLIEAYMKDVLTFVASQDPTIQEKERHSRPPSQVTKDQALPPRKWASTWLQRRKTARQWIEGFELVGVKGFSPQLDNRLHDLLGVRHLVVHSAGIVDEDYLRHHPNSPWTLGSDAAINDKMLREFIQATFEFFAPIEAHCVDRFVRI